MPQENHNQKQDIIIAEVKRDICWMKKEMGDVRNQVFNEIPHQIDSIKDKLMWGFVVGIASILILQIILKLF